MKCLKMLDHHHVQEQLQYSLALNLQVSELCWTDTDTVIPKDIPLFCFHVMVVERAI